MSKSLNNAFIRAYSKEKAHEAQLLSAAMATEAVQAAQRSDDFIVRFDTATCSIPEPHFQSKPPTETAMLAGIGEPKSAKSTKQRNEVKRVEPAAPVTRLESESVRDAIASQMSRAGEWEDQQIDAFIGGFPMISPFHQRVQQPHLLASESRQAQVASEHRQLLSSLESNRPTLDSPENSIAAAPLQAVPQTLEAEHKEPIVASEPPQLAPLEIPALADTQPPSEAASTQESASRDPQSRNQRVNMHVSKGEIFRLDRPSYSHQAADIEDTALSDSEMSSIIGSLSASNINLEVEPQPSTSHAKQAYANSVEDNLRRAKVRIFNPVWEVDNFQWPEVCLELLQQRASSMDKVAQNLVSACQEGLQVLAITSPDSGAGRTTVACCLAKLAGSRGLNVAIVDGDIENPTLSYQTNLDVEQDWKTAMFDQIPLEEVAVHSIDDQVTLVPLINPIAQYEMSTSDNRIESMLQELSASFDLVIVDMGHMNSPRSLVTSLGERGVISAIVAVVDHRSSSQDQIDSCIRQIRNTGVASIGLIENFAA